MVSYFLDEVPQKNRTRTVRSALCPELPEFYDRIYLGEYDQIEAALKKALLYQADIAECAGCRAKKQIDISRIAIRKAS